MTATDDGNNLVQSQDGCGFSGGTIFADPMLTPLGNHGGPSRTHDLLPGSPAIDAGDTDLVDDQRLVSRPIPSNGADDIGAVETDGVLYADLSVTKTDNLDTVEVGGTGTYVITVTNAGTSNASGASVSDFFPVGVTPGNWTCTGSGACPANGSGDIDGELVDLDAGQSVTFSVDVTYSSQIGDVDNTANVVAPGDVTDPDTTNNSATDETEIVSPATLSATKTGVFNPNDLTLIYTIEITNDGPQDQLDNPGPEMIDFLAQEFNYVSSNASSGTLTYDAPSRTLAWSGAVAVAEVITIVIDGTVDPRAVGTSISNQADVLYDADGNGVNEAIAGSRDPSAPGDGPTVIRLGPVDRPPGPEPIPAISLWGLGLLSLLLGAVGWSRCR